MVWSLETSTGNESAKCKYDIVPYTRGRGLDLGCGAKKAYKHFIGVDNGHHEREFGWPVHPDIVIEDASDMSLFGDESMDFVFSSHLLEHIEDAGAALAEWWRLIKVGGHLCLYLPHKDYYPNIGVHGSNPDHKHDFLPIDTIHYMENVGGWDLLINEDRGEGNEYSFLQVFRKRADDLHEAAYARQAKSVCVCRFGGFGDMIQASSIFPELKRQGYHITVMTTPKGQDIIKHDPHVDGWLIQDNDQVPNGELKEYWEQTARRFDKFINLSESVEGSLLAMPGRVNHGWPVEMRRKELGRNYLEFTAEIAEVPYNPEPKFYPTPEEEAGAEEKLRLIGAADRYIILWTLAGSSVHKMYPHQDAVLARIMMELPQATVILCGDTACKLLEQGWEDEKRVICTSGEMSIRDTLALALRVNCVVGPETGVLNAVAFEQSVRKVCLLSHSSHENLTRDWNKCTVIEPVNTACYPCHRLHYGRDYCPEDDATGASVCAASIHPDTVFDAIAKDYHESV